jgi:hypothetical protein
VYGWISALCIHLSHFMQKNMNESVGL